MSTAMTTSASDSDVEVVHVPKLDKRYCPPVLPPVVCWSAVTEPELYKQYIASVEGLTPLSRDEPSEISARRDASMETRENIHRDVKPLKPTSNKMDHLIYRDCNILWVEKGLFTNEKLPIPFNRHLFWSDAAISNDKQYKLADPPDLADAAKTAEWLNHLGTRLGILHGLVLPDWSPNHNQKRVIENCEDRVFIYERSNEEFPQGSNPQQSNIYVVDSSHRDRVPLQWPLVKAIVVVASHSKQPKSEVFWTLIAQATNVFNSQLQRRYVVGLALWPGVPGDSMRFSYIAVDRAGALCGEVAPATGFNLETLAQFVYGLTFGDNQLLGADPKVLTDPLTGHPQAVIVDGQQFTIIAKISASPHLFGRGTRVYIVKDQYNQFQILKDSWADASQKISEIDCLKNIAFKVQNDGLEEHSRILSPRFVAGENHVDHTDESRPWLPKGVARIRRRMVTGPIGDPITTYRSRVECLQVLLDVVDRLEFFHNKCDIVHGNISINNIIIVRFLPAIVSALRSEFSAPLAGTEVTANAAAPCQPATDGNEAGSMPSSLENVPTTTVDASSQPPPLPSPDAKKFLPSSPESGGSVIDFDCSDATNTLSTGPIGTLPYISVELTEPNKSCVRELRHDLESVFLVLLNLARFTCGPPGASVGEVKVSHRIAQWHCEFDIDILKDKKQIDILNVHKSPADYLTEYWAPIAPYIQELIEVVYGTGDLLAREVKSLATVETFKAVLVRALQHCQTLSEIPVSYPPIQPPPVARPNLKRARPDSWETDDDRAHQRSCDYQSSASDDMDSD